jgi:TolA-binding protein
MKSFVIRYSSFVILLLLVWGCQKRIIVPAPPPTKGSAVPSASVPQAITPDVASLPKELPEESVSLPEIDTVPEELQEGEKYFRAGNYKKASLAFEKFLAKYTKSKYREQALFYMGMSRATATDSSRDPLQAEAALRRLIVEFPQSQYRKQAEYMLSLQTQIEKLRADVKERDEKIKLLNEELQKLKAIDMQRRPRPGE